MNNTIYIINRLEHTVESFFESEIPNSKVNGNMLESEYADYEIVPCEVKGVEIDKDLEVYVLETSH